MWLGIRYYFTKQWAHLLHRRKSLSLWTKCFFFILLFIFFYGVLEIYLHLESHSNVSNDLKWLEKHNNLSQFLKHVPNSKYGQSCMDGTPVVLAVISATKNSEARQAVRSSWGKHLPSNWKLLFFVGKLANKTIEDGVEDENTRWRDIVLLDVHEAYTNLTLKVYLMFHWVYQQCKQASFLIKIDDDVYLSPHNIKNLLSCSALAVNKMYEPSALTLCNRRWDISSKLGHFIDESSRKYLTYIVGGYLYQNVKTDRNIHSKWYLSTANYESSYLPDFLSGTSYFMSMNLLPYVLNSSIKVKAVHLEDLYFTGLVMRESLNLQLNHINGWSRFRPRWDDVCYYNRLVTAHGLKPQELINITENVARFGNSCTTVMSLFSLFNEVVSYFIPRYTV